MGCEPIQQALVELEGDLSRLPEAQRLHLESCPACRAAGIAERRLGEILAAAVPPADPDVEHTVLEALRPLRVRRRLLALLPVAGSLLVALAGVTAVGGVPGGSMIARLPLWSSQGWLALLGAANDWLLALAATASAARLAVPPLLQTGSLIVALVGSASVVIATRRWRTLSPWRRHA
jgi:predicted anti-sigma-YlaC factor YlaD